MPGSYWLLPSFPVTGYLYFLAEKARLHQSDSQVLIFQWFRKMPFKWTGLNWRWLGIFSYIHTSSYPRTYQCLWTGHTWHALIPCVSWILNRRTHTAVLCVKYAPLRKTALHFYGRVFQFPLCTRLSQCSVLLQKFPVDWSNPLRDIISLRAAQRIYFIRRQARNFGSLNHTSLYWQESSASEWIPQASGTYQMPLNLASDFSSV